MNIADRARRENIAHLAMKEMVKLLGKGKYDPSVRLLARRLGIHYQTLRNIIHEYGEERFWSEYRAMLRSTVVEEATQDILLWLAEKAKNGTDEEKWKASQHLRDWWKVLKGENVKHSHDININLNLEVIDVPSTGNGNSREKSLGDNGFSDQKNDFKVIPAEVSEVVVSQGVCEEEE